MTVNYDKLWNILNERGMMKTELIKEAKISTNAMAKLGKNEDVRVGVLAKICVALGCKLDDIVENDFFAEYRPRRINITLYGADAASYNRLCHYPQGFDQTVRAIRLLRERNVDVKISCSVTKKNAHDFPKIFVLGEKLGVPVHADHYMMPAVRERSLPFDAQVRLNPEDAAALALQTLKLQLTSDIFRQYVHESIHRVNNPSFPRGNGHISCLAGNCSFFINWQGFLFPCVMLSEISAPVFDLGFISAWEKVSAAAQKISLSSQCCQCRLQPICRTCVAAAFLETSSYRGMPGYLCRYSEHYYHLLLAEKASFSSIAL